MREARSPGEECRAALAAPAVSTVEVVAGAKRRAEAVAVAGGTREEAAVGAADTLPGLMPTPGGEQAADDGDDQPEEEDEDQRADREVDVGDDQARQRQAGAALASPLEL